MAVAAAAAACADGGGSHDTGCAVRRGVSLGAGCLHHGLPYVLLGMEDDDVELGREHARYRHCGR